MKTILALSILFSLVALPGLAELDDADLDKIRLIVNEEIEAEQIDAKIQASEARTKEHINTQMESVDKRLVAGYNSYRRAHRPHCLSRRHSTNPHGKTIGTLKDNNPPTSRHLKN